MMKTFCPKGRFSGPIMPMSLIRRKGLSCDAKLLYIFLEALPEDIDKNSLSYQLLADRLGTTEKAIQKQFAELRRAKRLKRSVQLSAMATCKENARLSHTSTQEFTE